MKVIKLSILLVPFIILLSCKKEDTPIPIPIPNSEMYTGTATALKNGEEWESLTYFDEMKSDPSLFILRANVYNDKGFWRETFDIRRIRANTDIQEIISLNNQNELSLLSSDYGTIIDDGDVVGHIYKLDTTATNNFIQITNYNSSKAEIEGIFNVSMVLIRKSNGGGTDPPPTLEFTNGKFTAKVNKEWFE